MRNNKQPQEDPIRLDDLFQLKRQEKPDQQFWEEFDVQLQQKMLGSMVDRRNLLDRFRQFTLRKILPLSLAGSALAALVVSLSPLWKPVTRTSPTLMLKSLPYHSLQILRLNQLIFTKLPFQQLRLTLMLYLSFLA